MNCYLSLRGSLRYGYNVSEKKLDDETLQAFLRIQRELIEAERKMVRLLRKESKISEEVLRKIDYELDLEEARLMMEG